MINIVGYAFIFIILSLSHSFVDGSSKKIAFLFIVHDHMPLEEIWHEFFTWHVNDSSQYSIYIHRNKNFTSHENTFFNEKAIYVHNHIHIKWQHESLIQGIRDLTQEAYKDPLNEWFCTVTDACIPMISFTSWRNHLLQHDKSVINACPDHISKVDTIHGWNEKYLSVGIRKEHWRQSEPLFVITRKHASLLINSSYLDPIFQSAATDHLLPTLLAMYHLENETTCSPGYSSLDFIDRKTIKSYTGNDINPQLIQSLKGSTNLDMAGYTSNICSGVSSICHFTARKFTSMAKYPLLDSIGLLLGTAEEPYTGNPWNHHSDKLRHSLDYSSFYIIEHDMLRKIPDNVTAYYMHLDLHDATVLTGHDLDSYHYSHPIPSRKEGMLYESPKYHLIYMMRSGHRHAIPSMDIFYKLGLRIEDLIIIPESDMEQITIGDYIPNVDHQVATIGH